MSSAPEQDSIVDDYIGLVRDQQRILEYVTLNLRRINDNLTTLVSGHVARLARSTTTTAAGRSVARRAEIQQRTPARTLRRRVTRLGDSIAADVAAATRSRLAPRPPPGPPPAPPPEPRGPVGNIVTSFDSPVRIRPSTRQVREGTRLMRFRELADDPHTQTTCPIDRNTFEGDDSILQIRHCGHIFREMNLRQHFRRRPTCPLCRYDIRDYVAPETSTSGASGTAASDTGTTETSSQTSSRTLLRRPPPPPGGFPPLSSSLFGSVLSDALNNFPPDTSGNTVDIRYSVYVPHI